MTDLELLISDTLREHAREAPPLGALPLQPRSLSHRRWVVWASAVAATAVAAVWILAGSARHEKPGVSTGPSPVAVPTGQQVISYHGISLLIPAAWKVDAGACAEPTVDAVVPDVGWVWNCPRRISPSPVPTSVSRIGLQSFDPSGHFPPVHFVSHQVVIDGRPAFEGASRDSSGGTTEVLEIPDPGVLVMVSGPARARASALFATVRFTPVDVRGCRAHISSPSPGGNAPAGRLLPPGATSAVVCQYAPERPAGSGYWLAGSRVVPVADLASLAAARGGDKASGSAFKASVNWLLWYQVAYPGGERTVAVSGGIAPELATDGQRTVYFPLAESMPTLFGPGV